MENKEKNEKIQEFLNSLSPIDELYIGRYLINSFISNMESSYKSQEQVQTTLNFDSNVCEDE